MTTTDGVGVITIARRERFNSMDVDTARANWSPAFRNS